MKWWLSALLFSTLTLADTPEVVSPIGLTEEQKTACTKLRQYCKACHALGDLRFIYSESDEMMWNDLSLKQSPKSKELWVKKIRDVLAWPSDAPPPYDIPMSPTGDWMPKGQKRQKFAQDEVNGMPLRQFLLNTLQ